MACFFHFIKKAARYQCIPYGTNPNFMCLLYIDPVYALLCTIKRTLVLIEFTINKFVYFNF